MSGLPSLRVVIVDDEAPARRKISRLLREEPRVEIVGDADSGEAALLAIGKHHPDLVFLDIQMPGMDGFGVIETLSADAASGTKLPRFIFITAHDQYAVRAFEVHAFDYLLKPVSEKRFRQALKRAHELKEQAPDAIADRLREMLRSIQRERCFPERLLVQVNDRAFFVPVREIAWIESERNYLLLHCGEKVHTLRGTLESIQNTLDPKLFVRVNRSTLLRLDAVREMLPWFHGEYKVFLHDNTELRWSRRYISQRPELLKMP
jgi:two-component system, LytTR family, response regulator